MLFFQKEAKQRFSEAGKKPQIGGKIPSLTILVVVRLFPWISKVSDQSY